MNTRTLLSNQGLDQTCCSGDTSRVGDIQVCGRQSVGGDLLQLILTLLSVTGCDHTEAQLVQGSRKEVTKPRVTASDVDIFIFPVGHPFGFLEPAIAEPKSHQTEDVKEHISKWKKMKPLM